MVDGRSYGLTPELAKLLAKSRERLGDLLKLYYRQAA